MSEAQRAASLAVRVDSLLPQTQCRQCGYAGCRPYAQAIAAGRAGINQCPPGGDETIQALATLLGVTVVTLDPARGVHKRPAVAVIDEALCIGCTLCIQACPIDAIVGAAKVMHTVIAAQCTGCELCILPCPVDCIRMSETEQLPTRREKQAAAEQSRRRYLARNERLARDRADQSARRPGTGTAAEEKKRVTVKLAVERARARLRQQQTGNGKM